MQSFLAKAAPSGVVLLIERGLDFFGWTNAYLGAALWWIALLWAWCTWVWPRIAWEDHRLPITLDVASLLIPVLFKLVELTSAAHVTSDQSLKSEPPALPIAIERYQSSKGHDWRQEVEIRLSPGFKFDTADFGFRFVDYDISKRIPILTFDYRLDRFKATEGSDIDLVLPKKSWIRSNMPFKYGCYFETSLGTRKVFLVVLDDRSSSTYIGIIIDRLGKPEATQPRVGCPPESSGYATPTRVAPKIVIVGSEVYERQREVSDRGIRTRTEVILKLSNVGNADAYSVVTISESAPASKPETLSFNGEAVSSVNPIPAGHKFEAVGWHNEQYPPNERPFKLMTYTIIRYCDGPDPESECEEVEYWHTRIPGEKAIRNMAYSEKDLFEPIVRSKWMSDWGKYRSFGFEQPEQAIKP